MSVAVNRTSGADVMGEQLRTVFRATRREVAFFIGFLVVLSTPAVLHLLDGNNRPFDMSDELISAGVIALFGALAVWKGEEPSRRSYMWSMPYDRTRHTLIKVASGWIWVMALMACFTMWGVALTVLTDGDVVVRQTQIVLRDLTTGLAPAEEVATSSLRPAPAWLALMPFTVSTIAYLLGTVPVLLSDRPWRWYAAAAVVVLFGGSFLEATQLTHVFQWVFHGPFNVELLITGVASHDSTAVVNGVPSQVRVYGPDARAWAIAAVAWTTLALTCVLAAAYRYQER